MKVLFLPEVVNQFLELAQVLYDEGYLGFKDAAIAYSEQLFRDIQANLPLKVRKGAPAISNATEQTFSILPSSITSKLFGMFSIASMISMARQRSL